MYSSVVGWFEKLKLLRKGLTGKRLFYFERQEVLFLVLEVIFSRLNSSGLGVASRV